MLARGGSISYSSEVAYLRRKARLDLSASNVLLMENFGIEGSHYGHDKLELYVSQRSLRLFK